MLRIWTVPFVPAVALVLTLASPSSAEEVDLGYYLPAGAAYDPAISEPASVLGFDPGEWHVRPDQLVRYAEAIADASPRARLEIQGQTYEGRPQPLVIVTAPENHERLEALRLAHLEASDPTREPRDDVSAEPVVVLLGYSIHGNEASGSNAAPLVLYHLAAAQGPEIEALLRRTVVLVDPSFNPDGLARFAHWANTHRGQVLVADPNHREHQEAWPGGRTNHYWFDLNRDWILLQQPESRNRVRTMQRWRPNLVADFHEMGSDSTFFFQPGVDDRKHPLIPGRNVELTDAISRFHAARLDTDERLYYTREGYDDFYPGKTAVYPDFGGGVAFLFEQASARGHVRDTANGRLTFPFAIKNQFLGSLGMLDGAGAEHDALLRYQAEFYRSGLAEARTRPHQAWVYGAPEDEARAAALDAILLAHGIEVHRLASPITLADVVYSPDWARIVPVQQPQTRLLEVLFERRTEFEDPVFYDISSWTLPLALGLRHDRIDARHLQPQLLGEAMAEPATPRGRLVEDAGAPSYAYLLPWSPYLAPRALARLLLAGGRARVATQELTVKTASGERRFERGTILVARGQQDDGVDLDTLVRAAVEEDGLEVVGVRSGLTPDGIDLGSPSLRPLAAPKPLLLVGQGVSGYEAGEVWKLLDERFEMPLSLVEKDQLARIDLTDYTHVLLVQGDYGDLRDALVERLRAWVRQGGIVVATKSGAVWAAANLLERETAADGPDAPPGDAARAERIAYADYEEERAKARIPGSIVQIELDLTHPIAYGYTSPVLPVFRDGTQLLRPSENPFEHVAHYSDEPLLSGYVSEHQRKRLGGMPAVFASRLGQGLVVQILDNPNFRAYWYGATKLYMNAILLGPAVKTTSAPSTW